MTRVRSLLAAVLVLALFAPAAPARTMPQIGNTTFTADVTLTTTSETVITSSPCVITPSDSFTVVIIASAQLTTGTNTTAVTPRIRRGTATGGTLVGEANAVTIGAAAGSTEMFHLVESEQRSGTNCVDYSLTLQQTAASANGSALHGSIVVLVF